MFFSLREGKKELCILHWSSSEFEARANMHIYLSNFLFVYPTFIHHLYSEMCLFANSFTHDSTVACSSPAHRTALSSKGTSLSNTSIKVSGTRSRRKTKWMRPIYANLRTMPLTTIEKKIGIQWLAWLVMHKDVVSTFSHIHKLRTRWIDTI